MLIPLGPSSAAGVSSSPNTQLIKLRLVMQSVAQAISSALLNAYFVATPTGNPVIMNPSPIGLLTGPSGPAGAAGATGATGAAGTGALTNAATQSPGNAPFQILPSTDVPVDGRAGGAVPLLAPTSPADGMLFAVTDVFGTFNGQPCPVMPPTGVYIYDEVSGAYVTGQPGYIQGDGRPRKYIFKFFASLNLLVPWQ